MRENEQTSVDGPSPEPLCKRCGERKAACVIRQDDLCHDCFVRFVKTKVVKRMEAFRGQNLDQRKRRKFLLPVSLGVSSIALLHILDDHSQHQINRSGHAKYELQCLHVLEREGSADEIRMVESIKSRYPRHTFTTKTIMSTSHVAPLHKTLPTREPGGTVDQPVEVDNTYQLNLQNSLSSPSSRSDMILIARSKTIVEAAREMGCDGILWGDTTTRLSEKVLAETAKGRGFSLPWLVNDYQNSDGISILYPMKDVLKKEALLFVDVLSLSESTFPDEKNTLSKPAPVKNSTIDSLMTEYFQSVEENYPSIVANVVRTSSKLQASRSDHPIETCAVCDIPSNQLEPMVVNREDNLLGVVDGNGLELGTDIKLCYGCNRLMRGENG